MTSIPKYNETVNKSYSPSNKGSGELYCPVRRVKKDVVTRKKTCPVQRIRTDVVQRIPNHEVQNIMEQQAYNPAPVIKEPYHNASIIDIVNGHRLIEADPRCEWISDFMENESWRPGEIVFLDANCALGKNTFVEQLVNQGTYDRILILANRRLNKQQISERLGITDEQIFKTVDVMTYQALELDTDCWGDKLDRYGMIVVDEAHYFVCDSIFNGRANISLQKILEAEHPVKLFMSATLSEVQNVVMNQLKRKYNVAELSQKCSVYRMRKNKQHIRNVFCADFHEIIQQINQSSDKWMIFVDSKALGKEFVEELGKKAVFITAESSVNDKNAKAEYEHIAQFESFQHQVLVATSVLDNGVNIKDRRVRNIVIACNDRIEMIQMLGRKRCIDAEDSFDLFLFYYDKTEINQSLSLNYADQRRLIEYLNYLKANGYFPPLEYSLNTPEGENCREIIYLDERRNQFSFNYLGLKGLRVKADNLKELMQSVSVFQKKVDWLFGDFELPEISADEDDVLGRKVQRIVTKVQPYIGECFGVKSDEFKEFCNDFAEGIEENFSFDKDNKLRADRSLSAKKINMICEKQHIPIKLIKKYDGRKTCYEISHNK